MQPYLVYAKGRGVQALTPEQFLAKNPTEIATVRGVTFYEHPTKGDEAPLVAIHEGRVVITDAWDAGDLENDSGIFTD
jgi:hypothetical protein